MSVNLERNVQILSEHYVNRFKHLIDTNRREDATQSVRNMCVKVKLKMIITSGFMLIISSK